MSETKHAPGPWEFRMFSVDKDTASEAAKLGMRIPRDLRNDGSAPVYDSRGRCVALIQPVMERTRKTPWYADDTERDEMCRLIAAAPDHALVARLLCSGMARWERATREFCFNGLRYATELDEFGVPIIHDVLRAVIAKAEGR